MAPEAAKSNIVPFDSARRNPEQQNLENGQEGFRGTALSVQDLEQQVRTLAAKIDELQEMNSRLSEQNNCLRSAIEASHQRLAPCDDDDKAATIPPSYGVAQQPISSRLATPSGVVNVHQLWFDRSILTGLRQFAQQLTLVLKNLSPTNEDSSRNSSSLAAERSQQHELQRAGSVPTVRTPIEQPAGQRIRYIRLIASPFGDFSSLSTFLRSLQRLPGVAGAAPESLKDGKLTLVVHYADHVPFPDRLRGLSQFDLRLATVSEEQVTITIVAGRNG